MDNHIKIEPNITRKQFNYCLTGADIHVSKILKLTINH